jgi:DNA polymerase-3 subunit alpha/error-prone DNA polymerase
MKHRKSFNLPASPLSSSSDLPSPIPSCASEPEFVELLARSNFSFLQGASHPEEMVLHARRLGYRGLAICDVNGLYGVVRGYRAVEKPSAFDASQIAQAEAGAKASQPFHYMCGSEITPYDSSPVTLIPMNKNGYVRLCHLLTRAKRDAPKGHIALSLQDILDTNEDLIAIALPPWNEDQLLKMQTVFQDRLYLPVYKDFTWESVSLYQQAMRLEQLHGFVLFASGRPLFHEPERKPLHDVLTCILHGKKIDEAATDLTLNRERYLKTPKQIAFLFRERPDLLKKTLEISSRIDFSLSELRYRYPQESLPPGKTATEHLRDLVEKGLLWRYSKDLANEKKMQEVRKQIDHELKIIQEMEYEDYFLTLRDICEFANERQILHQGRGSAANSIVCFALGLTNIDPIDLGLMFERFLSKERGEPPDIDIDFEHERREEVIQHIYQKYGERRAAMVCTVICYRSRMAVREVAKVLGLSIDKITVLVKFMGREGLSRLQEANEDFMAPYEHQPSARQPGYAAQPHTKFAEKPKQHQNQQHLQNQLQAQTGKPRLDFASLGLSQARFRKLLELSFELQGFPRHLGIHTGGFVIANDSVVDIVPVESASMDKRYVIQWNKDDIDTLGLMKVDFLSLGMLTAISRALKLLKAHKGIDFNLAQIPQDDKPTYEMIQKADTVGVFQIESRAQMSLLPRLKPANYYDLVIEVAIVRPGPIQGGLVHPYLKRRKGLEKTTYAHPKLEPVLKKTLGIPLFQEQVMQIAVIAAGFTPGESDELRRVVSSAWKRKAVMDGLHQRVINGMLSNGLTREYAEQIYKTIEGFSAYGFPESHAASFALLTYVSCYLKRHHPDVFTCALLNSQPMGFYSPRQLIADAQRHEVHFLALDIQHSEWKYRLEERHANGLCDIRAGFCSVYGLREEHVQSICLAREREGRPFTSLSDLVQRTRLSKNVMIRIAATDAFASLGISPREALWSIQSLSFDPQSLFFSEPVGLDHERLDEEAQTIPKESEWDAIQRDYLAKGFSIDTHPIGILRPHLDQNLTRAVDLPKLKHRTKIKTVGLLSLLQKPPTAKGMCFLSIEDETGLMNVVIVPDLYQICRLTLMTHPLMQIEGVLESREGVYNIKATKIEPLIMNSANAIGTAQSVRNDTDENGDRRQLRLRSIAASINSQN